METLRNKLKVIYLPFLSIAVGCIVSYTFLDWLLIIEAGYTGLEEEVVNFWLPYGIPWIPILLWLRPRLKALRLNDARGNLPFLYCMVAGFAITAPTIVSQFYLQTATGKKTDLARIGRIDAIPKTKYYSVRDIAFDKANASGSTGSKFIGKNHDTVVLSVYLVCPVDDPDSPLAASCSCWFAMVYKKQISSSLSDSERETRFRAFIKESEANYRALDLKNFTYLERVGVSDDRRGLEAAVKRNNRFKPDTSFTMLTAHHDIFEERNGSKLAWAFGSFGIGTFVWFLMLVFAPVDKKEMDRLLRGEKEEFKPAFPLLQILIPKAGHFVTTILVDLNILVFVLMVLSGLGFASFAARDLLAWGGNLRSAVQDGQIWRLITSMFVHGGAMHLAGNLFGLFLAGILLEPVFGSVVFALCYILSGVAGGIASIYWHTATVSVGASGAIFGLMGSIVGFSTLNRSKKSFATKHMVGFVLYFVGYNLLLGLIGGGTDNADHLGGLACGLLIGIATHLFQRHLPGGMNRQDRFNC